MTWRIPPIGFCGMCLAVDDEERPAFALWGGFSLCREHLEVEYHADRIAPLDQIGGDA